MTPTAGPLGSLLVAAFEEGLRELHPRRLVREALPSLPPRGARVLVIAAGKAALPMVDGALERWGARIDDVLVVAPAASPGSGPLEPRITRLFARHPIPDERSVEAAEEALRRARALRAQDVLVVLVSGGASALLAAPPAGMPLVAKQEVVARLLDAGAPIRAVNLVRRHLSRIKGGRLAAAAGGARVLTLILSDVVGGEPHDVGSGPSVPDPSTLDEARAALLRWTPEAGACRFLAESPKPGAPGLRTRARVVADPTSLARTVAASLSARGFHVTVDPPDEGRAPEVARRRLERARELSLGEAVVIATEPTVELPESRGEGGRAGWIALAVARDLPPGVAFLCAASDGVDGTSGASGAIVTRLRPGLFPPGVVDAALARFDDAPIHRAGGTHLTFGPTGHNLADLHVLAREPAEVLSSR